MIEREGNPRYPGVPLPIYVCVFSGRCKGGVISMAEFTKGIENLQEAITSCEQANTALAAAGAAEAATAKTAREVSWEDPSLTARILPW